MTESSDSPPQTPPIKAEQKAERPVNDKKQSEPETKVLNGTAEISTQSAQDKSHQEAHQTGEESSEFTTIFSRRLKITDLLLVFFTAGLFVATIFLWLATRDLVEDAKHNAERQLRAYVSPVSGMILDLDFQKPTAEMFSVRIVFKNSGQTPAYDFTSGGDITLARFPLNEVLKRSDFKNGRTIIGPGVEFNANAKAHALTMNDWNALLSGQGALFIHGDYSYRDAFGENRKGTFRYYFGGPDGLRVDRALTVDSEGNEAN